MLCPPAGAGSGQSQKTSAQGILVPPSTSSAGSSSSARTGHPRELLPELRRRTRTALDSIINGTHTPPGGLGPGSDLPEDASDATAEDQGWTHDGMETDSSSEDLSADTHDNRFPQGELADNRCLCGLDLAACGACGRGWAQRRLEEPDEEPIPEPPEPVFWSTEPLRCEGCLELMPPEYELGLPEWKEKLPRSHKYALLGLPRLSCFPRGVRESVRWHLENPGKRPRTTRWWCIACNYQNDNDRFDFQANWSWRNRQEGHGRYYRTIQELAVNQFFWPRHVEYPSSDLVAMAWPEADEPIA